MVCLVVSRRAMPTASTAHRDDNAPAISPGLLVAALVASAAVAVSAFNLTGEVTLGIDLGTTYSVAAGGFASVDAFTHSFTRSPPPPQ